MKNGGVSRFVKLRTIYDKILKKPLSEDKFNSLSEQFSRIVVDEVVGQMLPLLAIPVYEILYVLPVEYYCIAAFLLFRLFDIW